MKIEEAISHYKYGISHDIFQSPVTEYAQMAVEALEKQIPKPPKNKVHEKYKALGKNYYCSCGVMFVDFERHGTNYCGNCGQRLK